MEGWKTHLWINSNANDETQHLASVETLLERMECFGIADSKDIKRSAVKRQEETAE